jgi:RimJ/RimL family protein N-acetyltransferase
MQGTVYGVSRRQVPKIASHGIQVYNKIHKGSKEGIMQTIRTFMAKDGSEITIRPAQSDDSCAIIDTVRSNANERSYVLMEHYGKDSASESEYISGLDSTRNLLIVASTNDEVVGCLAALQADAGMRPETTHILHIGLHLKEKFRGLGIGASLLNYSIEWASEKGFKKLEANIFTTNERSLSMFKKAGFVEEGVRKNRIRMGRDFISEVLMGKVL